MFCETEEKSLILTASHMQYDITRWDLQILAYSFEKINHKTIPASDKFWIMGVLLVRLDLLTLATGLSKQFFYSILIIL